MQRRIMMGHTGGVAWFVVVPGARYTLSSDSVQKSDLIFPDPAFLLNYSTLTSMSSDPTLIR